MPAEVLEEWIRKAEGDFSTARREAKVTSRSNYDAVCLHCQQCGEKYLKAFLVFNKVQFAWTHNLIQLLDACSQIDPAFELIRIECSVLNGMLRLRYPSDFAHQEDAHLAVTKARVVRRFVREKLNMNTKRRKN